ncbi:class I SAM-dependent methyltransferase [Sphingomonas crusticola]|uniref:class I SAM-dependent methyltransferase n=1 Tax=Sphingomonas crusticola TaxID=1697973 RepID=UPI0013C318DD|nr:class I SAM-dependent methyltransferase [Sphingomonas crusticola]
MDIVSDLGARTFAARDLDLTDEDRILNLTAEIDEPVSGLEVRLTGDVRAEIVGLEIDLEQPRNLPAPDPNRPVGFESRKTYADKIASGFLDKYLSGAAVLEVGYRGYIDGCVPIVPQAIGVDIGYPGYDGITLPFADGSFDAIYSSHCFEHIAAYQEVLRDWYRVLKVGGYLIMAVPHQYLFERRAALPSKGNNDHKRFYTPESLLREISESLGVNAYRVRELAEHDAGYNYDRPTRDDLEGQFEIEIVIEKIARPFWNLDNGSTRPYSAGEFESSAARPDPFRIEIDLSEEQEWLFWGPYAPILEGSYRVDFLFEASPEAQGLTAAGVTLDVAVDMHKIAELRLTPEMLMQGQASILFDSRSREATAEFRMSKQARGEGKIVFTGVVLSYAAPDWH